jgi:hypothetical protein
MKTTDDVYRAGQIQQTRDFQYSASVLRFDQDQIVARKRRYDYAYSEEERAEFERNAAAVQALRDEMNTMMIDGLANAVDLCALRRGNGRAGPRGL